MRRKARLSTIALMTLATLLSFTGLFTRNTYSMLQNPEVDVTPPEPCVGQHVLVKAKISVKIC